MKVSKIIASGNLWYLKYRSNFDEKNKMPREATGKYWYIVTMVYNDFFWIVEQEEMLNIGDIYQLKWVKEWAGPM